jgi:hypothetical protein
MNEHFRNHVAKEKTAFKTSAPWFLAGLAVFAVALILVGLGAPVVVAAGAVIAGLAVWSFAGHKHGKAGGEDHGYMY